MNTVLHYHLFLCIIINFEIDIILFINFFNCSLNFTCPKYIFITQNNAHFCCPPSKFFYPVSPNRKENAGFEESSVKIYSARNERGRASNLIIAKFQLIWYSQRVNMVPKHRVVFAGDNFLLLQNIKKLN